jgi:hypothetical protein
MIQAQSCEKLEPEREIEVILENFCLDFNELKNYWFRDALNVIVGIVARERLIV